jgi:hypothetical protein
MTAADAHLAQLSDDQRQVLEAWLVEFDLSWDERRLASWAKRLPPRGDGLRRTALVEMVKIDLERRWDRGRRAPLESYVKALPELGPADRLPADLVLAEYEARRQSGAAPDLADFARRFPQHADELRRLAGPSRGDGAQGTRCASQESTRPGDGEVEAGDSSLHRPVSRPPDAAAPDSPRPAPNGLAGGAVTLPQRLGRYHILRELGRGAMGTVYLAHDDQLDREVALKAPRFTAADGPDARQRFLSEARAAASIEHPNICPVYDVGEIDGAPYLTMAYLPGQTLSQLLEDPTPMPERHAVFLVRQLTGALQAAHDRGVIHRDLKPSNIMINQRGEPILLDFGLARRVRPGGRRLTQSGQPVGTPAYMSPEQAAGAVRAMGPGCDVYALGVILYQLLTGRLPFEGSVTEVLGQIVARQPDPPSSHRPGLDPRLDAVCLKAMSKEVADRYPSMRDLGAALADYLRRDPPSAAIQVEPSAAAPTTAAARAARPWQARLDRKLLWLLPAGAAAALLAMLVFFWFAPSTGTIRLDLDGPRDGVAVQVDGEDVAGASAGEALRLRPGKHHLLVMGKQIQQVSTSFTVAQGDNPVLRVQLTPVADAAPEPAPLPPPGATRHRHDDDDDDRPRTAPAVDPVPATPDAPRRRHHDDDDDDR